MFLIPPSSLGFNVWHIRKKQGWKLDQVTPGNTKSGAESHCSSLEGILIRLIQGLQILLEDTELG